MFFVQEEVDLPLLYPLKAADDKDVFIEVGHTRLDIIVRTEGGKTLFGVELKCVPTTVQARRQASMYAHQLKPAPVFLVTLSAGASDLGSNPEHTTTQSVPPIQIQTFHEEVVRESRRASP